MQKKSQLNLTLTSHPTNPNVAQLGKDSYFVRPKLWEEVSIYYGNIPQLIQNIRLNNSNDKIKKIGTWIGFDCDGHIDETKGIFIYSTISMLSNILKGYDVNTELTTEADDILKKMADKFNNSQPINYDDYEDILSKIKEAINNNDNEQDILSSVPLAGFEADYRIGSEDLKTEKGKKKIKTRLEELKFLKEKLGYNPVKDVIIANCTKKLELETLSELMKKANIEQLNITPLFEEKVDIEEVTKILQHESVKTAMYAGSDSIQRETFSGATIMKVDLMNAILEHNKLNPERQITFFEGTGSTNNRNGKSFYAKMGTTFDGLEYKRTIQGAEAYQFMINKEYLNRTVDSRSNAMTNKSSIEDWKEVEHIFKEIDTQTSQRQRELQQDGDKKFTNLYNTLLLYNILKEVGIFGSRSKDLKKEGDLKIKGLRAIDQSFVNDLTGFHPEMTFWDKLDDSTKKLLIDNKDNKFIKALIDHYSFIYLNCDLERAQKFANQHGNSYMGEFKKGYEYWRDLMKELNIGEEEKTRILKAGFECQHLSNTIFETELESRNKFFNRMANIFDDKNLSASTKLEDNFKTLTRQQMALSFYKNNPLLQTAGKGFSTNNRIIDNRSMLQKGMENAMNTNIIVDLPLDETKNYRNSITTKEKYLNQATPAKPLNDGYKKENIYFDHLEKFQKNKDFLNKQNTANTPFNKKKNNTNIVQMSKPKPQSLSLPAIYNICKKLKRIK